MSWDIWHIILFVVSPGVFIVAVVYGLLFAQNKGRVEKKYRAQLKLVNGSFKIDNVRRGISIIGAAGSGKTDSVIYNLLQHFSTFGYGGIIHDYKDFELTEIAYPLFKRMGMDFYTIAFDRVYARVNPIAPRYLPNEESVNEVSRVLMENLLEHNLSEARGSSKFFTDAVEGLLSGMIWKLKTAYPQICTLPHIIALFQSMDTNTLVGFLKSDLTAQSMAGAFINGIDSEKQTAGVKSTLANAFKKISSKRLFYILSKDDVHLDVNNPKRIGVISLVNNPKYDSVYAPVIAMVMHTVIKQMSLRGKASSFLLMEEAPTLKLPNMHRVPATLRSYDISTVYVMQDKVQNDLLYGDKASRAILSNLSYQFFGKANDPDTAKYYERFFELIKTSTRSVSRSSGMSFESRITKGEREIAKWRADLFFKLRQGEFIALADGKDKKVNFKLQPILKETPKQEHQVSETDLAIHFQKIHREVQAIFKGG